MIKNPVNPMFTNNAGYMEFRATVKIWLPSLQTLDGTGFSNDQAQINALAASIEAQKPPLRATYSAGGAAPLPSIPEKQKLCNDDDVYAQLKAK